MNKKIILLSIIFSVLILPGVSYSSEYVDGDVIVVFKPSQTSERVFSTSALNFEAASFAKTAGAELKETYFELSNAESGIYSLIHSDTRDAKEFADDLLKNNPNVLAASPNYKVYTAVLPNETKVNESDMWGMFYVDAPEAWEISQGADNVYVAIIDSGIDYSNPDITNNFDYAYSAAYSSIDPTDTNGHGTHVAGIIGAEGNNGIGISGINWTVKTISVRALPNGTATISDIVGAINYVTNLIKNFNVNIKAVNMSLEIYLQLTPSYENFVHDPFWRALKALDSLNKAVIVVAAGNQGETVGSPSTKGHGTMVPGAGYYAYPASFTGLNNMLSVGAISKDGTLASWSNKGATVAAPGVDILSTYKQSSSDSVSLATISGSSMAAPFISGAAALLSAIDPNMTAYQIKTAIVGGSSTLQTTSSTEKIFNLNNAITYQEENKNNSSIMPANPEATAYDNYTSYEEYSNPSYYYYDNGGGNNNSSGGSSGGGCNESLIGIFAVLVFVPLAKKFIS